VAIDPDLGGWIRGAKADRIVAGPMWDATAVEHPAPRIHAVGPVFHRVRRDEAIEEPLPEKKRRPHGGCGAVNGELGRHRWVLPALRQRGFGGWWEVKPVLSGVS